MFEPAAECRIRVLDEEVATKIAAGEVVERPASAVKELVENAVDAGATRITVEVEEGGKRLIRVSDNGCGMSAQEAVLALQRHATSKISRLEDLAAVRTLGFRGEALPSIATVSRLTIVTRARGELEGVRVEVEAGEIRELEPAGAAEGTVFTVRDLFHNTPARLKFLKSPRTELGQICDVLTRLAMSHPGVAVRLISDGDEVLHAPGSPDPVNTIAALFGNDLARELMPVSFSRPPIAVEGYVSKPTLTRPTRSGQHFFVNGRWIRNRTLSHALDEAFRATMPAGRHPFCVLHVEIDPALVDVNVHPAKAEVRFLRDWEVHRTVFEAIRQALGTVGAVPSAPLAEHRRVSQEALGHGPWLPPLGSQGAGLAPPPPAEATPAGPGPAAEDPFGAPDPGAVLPAEGRAAPVETQAPLPELRPVETAVAPTGQASLARPLRLVSQLWQSYILAEGDRGLVIVDQHLAHERVLFDRLRSTGEERWPSRRLTAPVTLQLAHREAVSVQELLSDLLRVGYELEPFGRDAYLVRAAPTYVQPGAELTLLRELLDELWQDRLEGRRVAGYGDAGAPPAAAGTERVAAAAACRAAVRKGTRLGPEELQRLLEDLSGTSNPHTCPHGCPIAVEIPYQELLKRFKRI